MQLWSGSGFPEPRGRYLGAAIHPRHGRLDGESPTAHPGASASPRWRTRAFTPKCVQTSTPARFNEYLILFITPLGWTEGARRGETHGVPAVGRTLGPFSTERRPVP